MKNTIAHIHPSYSKAEPNDLHRYTSQMDRFDSIVLCEHSDGGKGAPDQRILSFSGPFAVLGAFKNPVLRRLARPLYEHARDAFYAEAIRARGVALVHAHFGQTGAAVCALTERLGVPLVVSFYGVDVSMLLTKSEWVRRYQKMFKARALFIVLCNEAKERLVRIGCPPEKIRIADCLNDLGPYPYMPRTPGKTVKLLIAARFVEKKGYPVLLEALSRLVAGGVDVRLTAIGYGSARQREELVSKIAALGLTDRVSIVDTTGRSSSDFVGIYRRHLQAHDIFVLPSTRAKSGDDEGGPALTLVNAQAAGMPVVTTPFPGAERSVIDGKTGIYCQPDDPALLAEKLGFLIARPHLWNELGKAASLYVNEHLSLRRELDAIVAIYDELL